MNTGSTAKRGERPRYVLFAAFDGAGTHIIRGLFTALNQLGVNSSVGPSEYWSIAFDALRTSGGEQTKHLRRLNRMLGNFGVPPIETPDRETVYDRFEKLFSRWDIVLDFSRRIIHAGDDWSDEDIKRYREFILEYSKRADAKIETLFLVQIRNPLDHAASLCERYADEKHIEQEDLVAAVKASLHEISKLKAELSEALPANRVMYTRLDDIVCNYDVFSGDLSNFIKAPIPREAYVSKLSLDKWPTSKTGRNLLRDEEMRSLAHKFGYRYPRPLSLEFLRMRIEAELRRQINEVRLLIDTSRGDLEDWNPINAKHERKPYLATRVLVKITREWARQRARFYDHISKNN